MVLYAEAGKNEDIDELLMGLGRTENIKVCVKLAEPRPYFWLKFVGIVRSEADIKQYTKQEISSSNDFYDLLNGISTD